MSLQLFVLASGSKANAILLSKDNTNILIDAGLGIRMMASALNTVGVRPGELSAVLLTHEHTDHVRGLGSLLDRTYLPVYSSAGTLGAVDYMVPSRCKLTAMDHQTAEIGPFAVRAIAVPHDAAEPVGYHIEIGRQVLTIATDLGEVPEELAESLLHSTCIMLESNHDVHMLLNGSYPVILKERIRSPFGHLSNAQTASALTECRGNGLRTVVLAHLSEENNDPELARAAAERALDGTDAALYVTTRSAMGPFLDLE